MTEAGADPLDLEPRGPHVDLGHLVEEGKREAPTVENDLLPAEAGPHEGDLPVGLCVEPVEKPDPHHQDDGENDREDEPAHGVLPCARAGARAFERRDGQIRGTSDCVSSGRSRPGRPRRRARRSRGRSRARRVPYQTARAARIPVQANLGNCCARGCAPRTGMPRRVASRSSSASWGKCAVTGPTRASASGVIRALAASRSCAGARTTASTMYWDGGATSAWCARSGPGCARPRRRKLLKVGTRIRITARRVWLSFSWEGARFRAGRGGGRRRRGWWRR